MKAMVTASAYAEFYTLQMGDVRVQPGLLKKVLGILEAFPSQDLAFVHTAAEADFTAGTFTFGFSDVSHAEWEPYLTLSFSDAFKLSLDELRERVEKAAHEAAFKK